MSPLCRARPGLSPPRAPGWLRTRVCPRPRSHSSVRARTDTRGSSRLRPRGISQLLAGRSAPAAPPAPCPDLCTNPPGRPSGGYKEGARGCPRVTEPGTAMKASLLFLLACAAVLAVGARADSPEEPKALVQKVQELAQKATAMAKDAFSRVRESEAAQQARQWLSDNAELAKQRLLWLKEQLAELLKKTPAA
ncbi:apolipoprotein C-III [Vidua macroura]|uniref:apolipoprotein C-III n=1 Tax=Vidua macroura TaxID=187451 RepID=UPI0023A8A826|nr:apolipoprotein C-III [Vidua macroura]